MALNSRTIRPGRLVGLKTTIRGGVEYRTTVVEEEHRTENGAEVSKWLTEKLKADPAEHDRANVARSAARTAIVRTCVPSDFGYLCPEDRVADLEAGVAEARRIAEAFNATAQVSHLSVNVITGRILPDDQEAVKAINSELSSLLFQMERGIQRIDVKMIRDAADQARRIGGMLSPDANERVQKAVEIARLQARELVKAGEAAATAVDQAAIASITEARMAFLDFDAATEVKAPEAEGLAIDLMPEDAGAVAAPVVTNELEF
jgi:hypothetical protein